jgi:kinesin family member 3B
MSNKEKAGAFQQVVDVYDKRGVIEIINPIEPTRENKKMFTYDAVYNANSTQQSIYDEVVRPLVSSVLEGFNGCVFGKVKSDSQKRLFE